MSYYNLCIVIIPPMEVGLYFQWRYDCTSSGGTIAFPVEVRLHSQWKYDCIPIGSTIQFFFSSLRMGREI